MRLSEKIENEENRPHHSLSKKFVNLSAGKKKLILEFEKKLYHHMSKKTAITKFRNIVEKHFLTHTLKELA